MAKKKKEEPVVDNETGSLKVKEKQEVQPTGNETKGNVTKVKEKMKMKPQIDEETVWAETQLDPKAEDYDKNVYSSSECGIKNFGSLKPASPGPCLSAE